MKGVQEEHEGEGEEGQRWRGGGREQSEVRRRKENRAR